MFHKWRGRGRGREIGRRREREREKEQYNNKIPLTAKPGRQLKNPPVPGGGLTNSLGPLLRKKRWGTRFVTMVMVSLGS